MPAVTSIVSLADARAHLNFTADTSHDTELQGFIDAATPVIEDIVGAIVSTTWTAEEHDARGGRVIFLRHPPVFDVTTVTEYRMGTAYTLTEVATPALAAANTYAVDLTTGRILRGWSAMWGWGYSYGDIIQVTYESGRATVPANIRLAALELIRHLYQLSQQGGRPAFSGGAVDEGPWTPSGFAVPTRVIELLAPNQRPPCVA